MSLSQQIEIHNDYMVVVLRGEFSLNEALALAKEMFETGARHNAKKVLVDIRQMTGMPNTSERFIYTKFLAEEGLEQHRQGHTVMRMAYLGHAPTLDPTRFGEYVANNRGAIVRSAFSEQEAWDWLGIAKKLDESTEMN